MTKHINIWLPSPNRIISLILLSCTDKQLKFLLGTVFWNLSSSNFTFKCLCGMWLVSTSCCTYIYGSSSLLMPGFVLCSDSCSHGQVTVTLGETQRRESRRTNSWRRVQRQSNRRGWKEWRRIPVPLRGVHWTGQRHVPHVSGHRQDPTRWNFVNNHHSMTIINIKFWVYSRSSALKAPENIVSNHFMHLFMIK